MQELYMEYLSLPKGLWPRMTPLCVAGIIAILVYSYFCLYEALCWSTLSIFSSVATRDGEHCLLILSRMMHRLPKARGNEAQHCPNMTWGSRVIAFLLEGNACLGLGVGPIGSAESQCRKIRSWKISICWPPEDLPVSICCSTNQLNIHFGPHVLGHEYGNTLSKTM